MLKDTAPITCDNRVSEEPSGFSSDGTHAHEICSSPVFRSNLTTVLTGLLKKAACPFSPPSGSKPPEQKDIQTPSSLQITMLLQPMGQENKETQIRFKMQKDGEPVSKQTTIDRLWVTTQREAIINPARHRRKQRQLRIHRPRIQLNQLRSRLRPKLKPNN